MTEKIKTDTRDNADEFKEIYAHTQTLTPEIAQVVDEGVLWNGLMRFVREPEKFNEQIQNSHIKAGAGDRPDTVFERILDFGSHQVNEVVYLNESAKILEFHVQGTKDYPSSLLRMEIKITDKELPAVTFSYYAAEEPQVPAALRSLIERAWAEKDKDILERIILEKLELLKN